MNEGTKIPCVTITPPGIDAQSYTESADRRKPVLRRPKGPIEVIAATRLAIYGLTTEVQPELEDRPKKVSSQIQQKRYKATASSLSRASCHPAISRKRHFTTVHAFVGNPTAYYSVTSVFLTIPFAAYHAAAAD